MWHVALLMLAHNVKNTTVAVSDSNCTPWTSLPGWQWNQIQDFDIFDQTVLSVIAYKAYQLLISDQVIQASLIYLDI